MVNMGANAGLNEVDGRSVAGVGLREWCRARGVAPSSLNKALMAGRVARLSDGSLDVASADEWLAARDARKARQSQAALGPPRGERRAGGAESP